VGKSEHSLKVKPYGYRLNSGTESSPEARAGISKLRSQQSIESLLLYGDIHHKIGYRWGGPPTNTSVYSRNEFLNTNIR
jgi:hypothetical protein